MLWYNLYDWVCFSLVLWFSNIFLIIKCYFVSGYNWYEHFLYIDSQISMLFHVIQYSISSTPLHLSASYYTFINYCQNKSDENNITSVVERSSISFSSRTAINDNIFSQIKHKPFTINGNKFSQTHRKIFALTNIAWYMKVNFRRYLQ